MTEFFESYRERRLLVLINGVKTDTYIRENKKHSCYTNDNIKLMVLKKINCVVLNLSIKTVIFMNGP